MDPKGDDSGSDTLDQSLQKKCVVADDDSSSKQPDAAVREDHAAEEPTTEPGGNMSDSKDSPASPSPPPPQQLSTDNNTSDSVLVVVKDEDLPDENTSSSNSGKDDSRGFESKVRQISDDLKDTTLADENSLEKVVKLEKESQNDDSGAADADMDAAVAAAASVVKIEDVKNESDGYDSDRTITYESPSKQSSVCSSVKKIKKVRFILDGKVLSDDERSDEAQVEAEDEYYEEDTLTDRSKKIRLPLSFVSARDEDDDTLSDEASAQLLADEAEPEVPPPEGGVESILGKLSRMGKIEYLFRWVNKSGLQWESEEILNELCPNLIKHYEAQRAKEREQDLHYAMRRKKLRQDLRNV